MTGSSGDGDRPLRLLVVRPTLGQGGADRVTLTLLEALDRRRFAPELVLLRRRGAWLDRVPADVPVDDLGGRRLWTAWLPLARRLRRRPPDVVLSTSSGANVVAALAHRLAGSGARLVLSERNVLVRDQAPLKRALLLAAKRRLYRRADAVTAVSRGVADDLRRRLGVPAERLRVVYNPVVTAELAAQAAAPARHPWLAAPEPVVLAAGRLVPAKGFDVLLHAFAELRARRPARLLILGEGPLREELLAQAERLGVGADVDLPGFDPNPFAAMARCAVFVLSSRFEGLPGVLIQAMACGAAVVATDCPAGPAEIVESGADGLLVPVDEPRTLAAALSELLDDDDLRRRLGARAAVAAQRFAAAGSLAAYEAVLSGEAPPAAGRGGAAADHSCQTPSALH